MLVSVRLQSTDLAGIDIYRERFDPPLSRPDAIRQLADIALTMLELELKRRVP
jgi:hypothetical protein